MLGGINFEEGARNYSNLNQPNITTFQQQEPTLWSPLLPREEQRNKMKEKRFHTWWYEKLGLTVCMYVGRGGLKVGRWGMQLVLLLESYQTVPTDNTDRIEMQFAVVRRHPNVVKEIQ